MYFSGQGKLYIASRDENGNPGAFRFVGNVPALEVQLATDTVEHRESQSGQRLTDHRMIRAKTATVNFTLEEFLLENLALALYGTKSVESADSVTDEVFPEGLVPGDFVRLDFPKVSNVVIKDSTEPAAATLNEDEHYRIASADHGTIQILKVEGLVQPFKASYSYAQHTRLGMFTQPAPERWFRFEGLNTEDSNAPFLVELYRVRIDPVANLPLISEELGSLQLTGLALYDDTRAGDNLGQFGRYVAMV